MIRSNAPRSTTRSLMTGKAFARHGSIVMTSPSEKLRMCSWQVVVFSGPWASPEIISPQVPQMPSRQSESKAMGSSPAALSCSLSTSSISRKLMSGLMSLTLYVLSSPLWRGPACRQILSVRFMRSILASWTVVDRRVGAEGGAARVSLVAPLLQLDGVVEEVLLVQDRRPHLAVPLPT